MLEFIILGLLIILLFVAIREDVREHTDNLNSETDRPIRMKDKARKDAIVDMSEEGMNTMLLKHDNFFKETYW